MPLYVPDEVYILEMHFSVSFNKYIHHHINQDTEYDNYLKSPWNSAHCYVADWMGGRSFRGEWIHVYMWLSPLWSS